MKKKSSAKIYQFTSYQSKEVELVKMELQRQYERITDRRVTNAVKKKERDFAKRLYKELNSVEERFRAELEENKKIQTDLESELNVKSMILDAVDIMDEIGMDVSFRKLIPVEDLADMKDGNQRKNILRERVYLIKDLFESEMEKAKLKQK